MNHSHENIALRKREGHSWMRDTGSNVSFTCIICGINGYVPAKEAEAGIKTRDDCDHHVVEEVLKV